jgi:polysaccharide deacetylase 2 family uncharacterized protein YibQ
VTSSVPTTVATPGASVPIGPEVAALPDGRGAKIAIGVDDVGGTDTYLTEYLRLPQPLTFSIMPLAPHAAADDAAAHAAGRHVTLHIPLQNKPGAKRPDGLTVGMSRQAIDDFLNKALQRVPHAEGANNHEGSWGSTQPAIVRPLIEALHARQLFFYDSVTSGKTVGFATLVALGLPPKINNVFLDHVESDADSRQGLFQLATIASRHGSAIGICHAFHPYLLHAMQAYAAQLEAKGYTFVPISEVTNAPVTGGVSQGVRTSIAP